jgi:predicted MFS family arabinose efflux permease
VGLLFCLWPLAGGTLSVLIPAYAFESFHAGSWGVGVLYGSLGLGYLIGGLLTGRLGKQVNGNGRVVAVLTVACEGLLYLLASQAGSLWPAALMMLIGTVAGGVGNAASDTLVMVHAPSEVLGRVYGLLMTVSSVSLVTAMLLSGLALNVMAPSTLGLCSGAVLVLASAVAWVIGRPRSAGSVE